MRHIYQSVYVSKNGKGVPSGNITVYLAATSTLATVYTTLTGGSAVTGSVVQSDSSGNFSFYVDDADYGFTQKFKIVLSKAEFVTTTYDNISVIPTDVYSGAGTGGSGSAGAGNQYVSVVIGGTTYKLLHDGTI